MCFDERILAFGCLSYVQLNCLIHCVRIRRVIIQEFSLHMLYLMLKDLKKKEKFILQKDDNTKERKLSNHCFIALIWAIILVRLWMSFWIIQLLPVLFAFFVIKKLGKYF